MSSTQVWGILNVTADSFSDGGQFLDPDVALAHALQLRSAGAAVVDVGGESTRPGAERVPAEEELRRVLPVISALASAGVPVSVDTMRASTARAAVAAGARIVNDVSGGKADPEMLATIAELGVDCVLMHWRGDSTVMDSLAVYEDVVADVCTELAQQVELALAAGVDAARIVLDPGLGFAKTAQHNWQLLDGYEQLHSLGFPLLVGASRKRFLSDCTPAGAGPEARDAATHAITALLARQGCFAVRVHDVAGSVAAVKVASAWAEATR